MRLIPKLDRVLIRRESLQDKKSLIHLPDDVESRNRPARGTVIAIGPTVGYVDEETKELRRGLEVGMKVIFGRNAGVEIEYEGERFWLLTDRDVLAEISEET